jgi:hypothetical protein
VVNAEGLWLMRNFGVRPKISLDGDALPVGRSLIKWFQRIDSGKRGNVEYFVLRSLTVGLFSFDGGDGYQVPQ